MTDLQTLMTQAARDREPLDTPPFEPLVDRARARGRRRLAGWGAGVLVAAAAGAVVIPQLAHRTPAQPGGATSASSLTQPSGVAPSSWVVVVSNASGEATGPAATSAAGTSAGSSGTEAIVTGVLTMVGGPAGAAATPVRGTVTLAASSTADGTGYGYSVSVLQDGRFTVSVVPGKYTVTGTSPDYFSGTMTCLASDLLDVSARSATQVTVTCQRR
ncbi:MAG: hypothetical protein U0Q14_08220 [Dermatophilaceae bacterium]